MTTLATLPGNTMKPSNLPQDTTNSKAQLLSQGACMLDAAAQSPYEPAIITPKFMSRPAKAPKYRREKNGELGQGRRGLRGFAVTQPQTGPSPDTPRGRQ